MTYKYQMHAHSWPCSRCAKQTVEELVAALHAGGYRGCVLTNHFLHGNSGIDKALPWEEFVLAYEREYLRGKAAAEPLGIDLLFGLEEGMGGGLEVLCYGITPRMLYDHPELANRDLALWRQVLAPLGVLLIQAHPFREKPYIPQPGLLDPALLDGIEVFNYWNTPQSDALALRAAEAHPQWLRLSGADSHAAGSLCLGGIECTQPILDEGALAELLKSGQYILLTAPREE